MTEHDKPWRAARYLMRGRPIWNTAWIDTIQWRDPRAYLEQRLGELEDFEWIDGAPAMSMPQALSGEMLRVPLPEKRRSMRNSERPLASVLKW